MYAGAGRQQSVENGTYDRVSEGEQGRGNVTMLSALARQGRPPEGTRGREIGFAQCPE